MTAPPDNSWQNLFAAGDEHGPAQTIDVRVVKRRGRPFLILPSDPVAAVQTLNLYSAQTLRARAARRALRWAIEKRRSVMSKPASLNVALDDPFIHFLQNVAHSAAHQLPNFGALAGNPNTPGQRFILMIFNNKQIPVAVVKAGLTGEAKNLIEREAMFLESVPGGTSGAPALRGRFETPRLRALATNFIEGESPRTEDETGIPTLLTSWLNRHKTTAIGLTRTWWEIEQNCGDHPALSFLAQKLPNHIVHPAIFHGDFVPWNCRVQDKRWMVLDWERGQLSGLPGYDWFHYLIQTRILVQKKSVKAVIRELKQLFDSSAFQSYAERARISDIKWELAMTYLLHHNEVIHPGEGLVQGRKLLNALLKSRNA